MTDRRWRISFTSGGSFGPLSPSPQIQSSAPLPASGGATTPNPITGSKPSGSILPTPQSDTDLQGSSSGGGGFGDKNSSPLLDRAARGLAQMIRRSSPIIYSRLPSGWNQERLASIIENIRQEPLKNVPPREGRPIMFDYGTDKKGPFIVAFEHFFVSYENSLINFSSDEKAFAQTLMEIRLKLAHEVAHLFKFDEEQAEHFALQLMGALERDSFLCRSEAAGEWITMRKSFVGGGPRPDTSLIIHRPSGLGFLQVHYDFVDRNGQPPLNDRDLEPYKGLPVVKTASEKQAYLDGIHRVYEGLLTFSNFRFAFQSNTPSVKTGRTQYSGFMKFSWTRTQSLPDQKPAENISFTAQKPITKSESLLLRKDRDGHWTGDLTFRRAIESEDRKLSLSCEDRAKPLDEEVVSEEYFKVTEREFISPIFKNKELFLEMDDLNWLNRAEFSVLPTNRMSGTNGTDMQDNMSEIQALNQKIEGQLSQALGGSVIQYFPLVYRNWVSITLSQAEYHCGSNELSGYLAFGKTFRLRDGRRCSVAILKRNSLSREKNPLFKITLMNSIDEDARAFDSHVACFRNDRPVKASDIAARIPKVLDQSPLVDHESCEPERGSKLPSSP